MGYKTNGLNISSGNGIKAKDKDKEQLARYLKTLTRFPKVIEHKGIAASFGVLNYRPIFKADAERRLLLETSIEPQTAATIEKLTGLNHKYICRLKRSLEAQGVIKVVYLGRCPTTTSNNVQFLSSTPKELS